MPKVIRKLCALAVVAQLLPAASHTVAAQELIAQGQRWLRICTSERRVDEAMCAGFIMGMEETQFLAENKPQFCPPPRFTVDDQKQIIVKYLKANPGRLGEAFARLAVDALKQAYPCRS